MGEPRGRAPKNLPQRVERAGVERGTVAVWYLGGAGLILKTPGAIVYVDPYTGAGDDDPALGGRGVPLPLVRRDHPVETWLADSGLPVPSAPEPAGAPR